MRPSKTCDAPMRKRISCLWYSRIGGRKTSARTKISQTASSQVKVDLCRSFMPASHFSHSHLFGRRDSQQRQRFHQFFPRKRGKFQQERTAFGVFFRKDVMFVIERVESLRNFESVARDKGGLLGRERCFESRVQRTGEQN